MIATLTPRAESVSLSREPADAPSVYRVRERSESVRKACRKVEVHLYLHLAPPSSFSSAVSFIIYCIQAKARKLERLSTDTNSVTLRYRMRLHTRTWCLPMKVSIRPSHRSPHSVRGPWCVRLDWGLPLSLSTRFIRVTDTFSLACFVFTSRWALQVSRGEERPGALTRTPCAAPCKLVATLVGKRRRLALRERGRGEWDRTGRDGSCMRQRRAIR